MSDTQLSVPLSKEQAYALVDAVMERDDLALSAAAREETDDVWVFEAMCKGKPDIEAFNQLAEEVLDGAVQFEMEKLDTSIDWVARSLEGLTPVIAGGFYVYGSHEQGQPPAGKTPIRIDAAQAFGTGHHETTTGCLEAIEIVLKRANPQYMLDVGTGTGILAIALAKRTRLPVIASDIDPVATQTTENNARLNGVANFVVSLTALGLSDPVIKGNGPYDLIVANILAGPLKSLAPDIGRVAQPGASIILSGILHHQAAGVIGAYALQNMLLEQHIRKGEWSTLILRRAAPAKRMT